MTFKVTILGSSAALPLANKHHSAHALNVHEQFYLIDCGEGTQSRLLQYGINPLKLNAVFISHLHGDHVYGLFPLLSTLGLLGKKTPLQVFGPPMLAEILDMYFRYFENKLGYEIKFAAVDTTKHELVFENKVLEVWSVPLRHRVASTGYLFREKRPGLNVRKEQIDFYGLGIKQIVAAKRGEDIELEDGKVLPNTVLTYTPYTPRSYAYCSDTMYSGKVASLLKGVDLLYHEATFADADKGLAKATGHSTSVQAATVAMNAGVRRLIIGHLSARYKDPSAILEEAKAVFPDTELAIEGRGYEIPYKKG